MPSAGAPGDARDRPRRELAVRDRRRPRDRLLSGRLGPSLAPTITQIAQEVAALGGALVGPDAPASASGPVVAAARGLGGALYVFAVNPTRSAVRGRRSRLPGLGGRPLEVLEEGRTVASSGDSFTDAFAPLAVHLYVARPG